MKKVKEQDILLECVNDSLNDLERLYEHCQQEVERSDDNGTKMKYINMMMKISKEMKNTREKYYSHQNKQSRLSKNQEQELVIPDEAYENIARAMKNFGMISEKTSEEVIKLLKKHKRKQ